jgi:hypothetical protein
MEGPNPENQLKVASSGKIEEEERKIGSYSEK